MLKTIIKTLPGVADFGLMLATIIVIYSVIGMQVGAQELDCSVNYLVL